MAVEIVCGFHAVQAVLEQSSDRVIGLLVDQKRRDPRMQELLDVANKAQVATQIVDLKTLDKQSNGARHQGVVAKVKLAVQKNETDLFVHLKQFEDREKPLLILMLDQVTDPHNLGACLRTADGAGVDAVVLPKDGAAGVNETVRRVAAGAADRMSVFYVTNLARCLDSLKEQGVWITGLGEDGKVELYGLDLRGHTAVVMGAEGKGLRRLTREHCDQIARIPMAGGVSSLNVSVATGVVLFEVVRQRQN